MWKSRDANWNGVLRLPAPAIELGRVLVDRANAFIATHSDAEEMLRRIFTLKLSTVRQDGEPTRRRAARSEFSDEEWRLVSQLADHPNRLLVTTTPDAVALPATLTVADAKPRPSAGETYAEVAHEAIFRRWDKLRDWVAAEREFLAWRTSLEGARRTWEAAPPQSRNAALLSGLLLAQAQAFLAQRPSDFLSIDRAFIAQSVERDWRAKRRVRWFKVSVYVLLVGIIVGLIGWMNEAWLAEQWRWFTVVRPYMLTQVRPHVLAGEAEGALKAGDAFKECVKDCPEMVVIPDGEFIMGSPAGEQGRYGNEGPQHKVVFAKPFAVSRFDVTHRYSNPRPTAKRCRACHRARNLFAPNEPTGEDCLLSHLLPQSLQFALFLPILSPHGYAVCVPPRAAYSNSASESSRYGLPVMRESHAM
jgi:hypothetical protein